MKTKKTFFFLALTFLAISAAFYLERARGEEGAGSVSVYSSSTSTSVSNSSGTSETSSTSAHEIYYNTESKTSSETETKAETSSGTSSVSTSGSTSVSNGGETTTATKSEEAEIENDTVTITSENPNADKMEYYVQKEGASYESYLGTAEKGDDGKWRYNLDAEKRLPNGQYHLQAKVKNKSGEYEAGKMGLKVNIPKGGELEKRDYNVSNNNEDSDSDGLPDFEEKRLGTDLFKSDSDRDGYLDSDEIKNGFNPLKSSDGNKSDKIAFQSPKEEGIVSGKYQVRNVEAVSKEKEKKAIKLSGKGLPNSFVTLYIYSDSPIIVTVKTDANGDWVYELDKELEDGNHEVYVAVTDNTGKITAKSEPLPFVKTAEAVSVVEAANLTKGNLAQKQSPAQKSKLDFLWFAVAIISVFAGLALVIIGAFANRKPKIDG